MSPNPTPDPRERAMALMMKNRPARKRSNRLRRGEPGAVGQLRRELNGEGSDNPGAAPADPASNGAGGDPQVSSAELAELAKRNEELSQEASQFKDAALRTKADLENFRKRAARERQQTRDFAIEDLLKELVPIVDNFDLALTYGAGASDEKSLRGVVDGVKMIHKQLFDTLANRGVKKIGEVGEAFDPQFHEAVAMVEPEEGQEENIVSDVVQSGYTLKDRVVRPAKVRITKRA